MNTFCSVTLTILASCAWLPNAWAATGLETIVIFGERDARHLSETTSSTDVVDQETISAAKVEHLNQVLQGVPGVWLSRGSGQEHLTAIRSPVWTGAGACGAFGMTEDGIALRANGFCNANQMFDSHYEMAQSIEIYKGPHTSMVGGNAQFGGINVHLPSAFEVENRVALRANSEGYRRFNGGFAHLGAQQAGAALVTLTEDDGHREQSGFKQQKVSLKHHWRDDNWRSVETGLTLMRLEQETAGYIGDKEAYKDPARRRGNDNPEAFRDVESLRLYSRFRQRSLDTEWVVTPYLRSNEMDFKMHFLPWKPLEQNSHDSVGWQLQWSRFLARGSKVFWGQEFEQTWASLTETQADPSPFRPEAIPQGIHYDYRISAQNGALYAGGLWQKTTSLALDTALRFDFIRYDYDNRAGDGSACDASVEVCEFYRPASRSDTFAEPSAHVGAVYHLRNELYGFGRMALSFRAPQATELYRAQAPDIEGIDAEQTRAVELGVRGERQRWFFELAVYAMDNRDGIIQNTEQRYVNDVRSRHLGLEYEVQYGAFGDWTLTANGQIAQHTYRNNPPMADVPLRGREMDTAPRHEHSLRARWWPVADVTLEAFLHRQGEYYLDPANRFSYSGHTLLDLESSWHISPAIELQASVLNALDSRYADRADVFRERYRYFPGQERRVAMALSYRF